jgi:hypothetical protein
MQDGKPFWHRRGEPGATGAGSRASGGQRDPQVQRDRPRTSPPTGGGIVLGRVVRRCWPTATSVRFRQSEAADPSHRFTVERLVPRCWETTCGASGTVANRCLCTDEAVDRDDLDLPGGQYRPPGVVTSAAPGRALCAERDHTAVGRRTIPFASDPVTRSLLGCHALTRPAAGGRTTASPG